MELAVAILATTLRFTEMRAHSGIDVANVSGDVPKHYIVSSLGGGAALFDYDGDGDLDLYLVNGMKLVARERKPSGGNRLYRNDGGWRFVDVTEIAGVGHEGWGVGCAVGDYDNDGFADLYVTNIGANALYRNRGDGTFVLTSDATDDGFGASAAFFDADDDGDLDLYAANYVDPDLSKIPEPGADPTCVWLGMPVMCGPRGLGGQRDVFYRNDDGRLVDATAPSGLDDPSEAYGLGVVASDYDDDGDVDLYVANDTRPNFLYQNDGKGRFRDVGLLAGAAYNASGDTEAGMGADLGDPSGDGYLDIIVTNFSHETNTLYLGSPAGIFTDATEELGLSAPSLGRLGWASRFADFDRDGDEDLFVANGHVYPNVADADDTTTYRQPNQIFVNAGDGTFAEQTVMAGERASSRGAAFGDVDDDGDIDVVVVNIDDRPSLLRNDEDARHWLGLRLVGRASNRDAEGARVRLASGGRTQLREVHGSGSIFSANDQRLHYGLGSATEVDELTIRWPSGGETVLTKVKGDRYLVVVEGIGAVSDDG